MTEESLVTQGLQDILGKEMEPEYFEVEKGHIRRFAQAVGDSNPRWSDPECARKYPQGGIVGTPTFLIDIALNRMAYILMDKKHPSTGFLNGSTEIEYYRPVRVGDTITSIAKLADLQEKSGKRGKMLFMTIEVNFKNQNGEAVLKLINTFIAPQNR